MRVQREYEPPRGCKNEQIFFPPPHPYTPPTQSKEEGREKRRWICFPCGSTRGLIDCSCPLIEYGIFFVNKFFLLLKWKLSAFKRAKIASPTAPEAHPMDPDDSFDYLFKVVLIGDMGIGKTCVVQRFKNGTYIEKQGTTIGVDFTMKTLMVEGKRIKLQIWDTGGQERFRTITQSYYRSANGIILCYDLTCPESFVSLQRWIDDVSKFAVPNVAKILVGTKADLVEEQGSAPTATASSDRVDTLEAEQLCRAHAMLAHLEVSSKQNVNVDTIFHELAHHLKCQYDELGHLDGTAGGRAAADAFRLGYPNTTNLSARWRRCCNYYA